MKRFIRLTAVWAALMLLFTCAAGAETIEEVARSQAQAVLDELKAEQSGWVGVMLQSAEITDVYEGKNSMNIQITVPKLSSGVSGKTAVGDDAEAYLKQAYAPYLNKDVTENLKLNLTWTEKDGEITTKWSGVSNPRALLSSMKGLAAAAKKTYVNKNMRAAVSAYLMPKAWEKAKKQPEETPDFASLAALTSRLAPALSLTEEAAEGRLPALFMLMELTAIDATDPLEQAVLTVKVDDWDTMVGNAVAAAKAVMDGQMGCPEMSREEIERFLWDALPDACVPLLYDKKGVKEQTITVNLAGAVGEGPQASGGYIDFLQTYSTRCDKAVNELMAYAATLDYYPQVGETESGVLTGTEADSGTFVTFDTGSDTMRGAYVRIRQDGQNVLTGYARAGDRLTMCMKPGSYTVYYTLGETWYGETYCFGKDGEFGRFDVTIPPAGRLLIHLQDGGELAVTPLDEAAFQSNQ